MRDMDHTTLGNYTPEELMAVIISREIKNGENVGLGAASPIPAAGCLLAEHLHAPEATIMILGSESYFPFSAGSSELHFLAQRGELDLFFLSGLQIDRHGNINLHVLGDYDAPKKRLPGAYGSAMLYYMAHRVILFRTEHTRRSLVEKVDFITAPGPGVTPPGVHREGGPSLLVTPKARFDWEKATNEWVLTAVHGGASVAHVEENTGFPVAKRLPVAETPAPTPEELSVLRTAVRAKLRKIYPDFTEKHILPGNP